MTANIAQLRREIAAERADLHANLALLEDRARELTDWRRQVRNRPFAAVGAAAAGGLLLAMMIDGRPRSAASEEPDGTDGPRARSRSHPMIERIVSALAVVAAERAFAALGVAMPSLFDEAADDREPRATRGDRESRANRGDREPRASGGGGK